MSSHKRICLILLSVLMVASLSTVMIAAIGGSPALAEPTITVGHMTGEKGDVMDIPIVLSGNPGIVSMTLEVTYDEAALELLGVADTGLMPGEMHTDRYSSPYTLTWENDTVRNNITVNGEIATLQFKILTDVEGDYPITLGVPKDGIYNVDVDNVDFALVNGMVTVGEAGHTCVYEWQRTADEHWKKCTDDACGKEQEGSRGSHADANTDSLCDGCGCRLEPNGDGPAVMLSAEQGCAGDTVDVSVMLMNNPGIVSMTLEVTYDEAALELLGVADTGLMPGEMHTDRYSSPYTLTWENDTVRNNITVNGEIATLQFKILTDVEGDYPITLGVPKDGIYNVDVDNVDFALVNGMVTVMVPTQNNTLSGTIISYGTAADAVTVRLLDAAGVEVASVTTADAAYTVTAPVGEYILEVSKKNHVTRTYAVAVEEGFTFDVEICLIGDVNGDGRVTIADYGKILNHCKRIALLDGYAAVCADVNSDGRITIADYGKVLNHCKRIALLWQE